MMMRNTWRYTRRFLVSFYAVLMMAVVLSPCHLAVAAESNPVNVAQDEPLEITADKTLEWHRNDQKYIARGNAKAAQGDVSITAAVLTADYRETQQSSADIYQLTAERDVVIHSKDSQGYADRAVYDVETGLATMTGSDLRLVSPDQTLTAQDRFEYWVEQGKMVAVGRPKVLREKDELEADKMVSWFSDNAEGQRELDRFEANGNVIITTPTEVLTGDKAVYVADTNVAEVIGNVKIERGQNVLEGERAEINLTTSVSKMHGASGTGGRVRGVFYPGSDTADALKTP